MMDMLAKSATLVMGNKDFDDVDNANAGMSGGGLGGELQDFEDMDGSFNNENEMNGLNQSNENRDESRRGTFGLDLNQSMNSDNQEFQNKLYEL